MKPVYLIKVNAVCMFEVGKKQNPFDLLGPTWKENDSSFHLSFWVFPCQDSWNYVKEQNSCQQIREIVWKKRKRLSEYFPNRIQSNGGVEENSN